ncbi:MAG TPA: RNA polymerase sigma factor RpoD/SigA [Vampirovibrionales bacterium]
MARSKRSEAQHNEVLLSKLKKDSKNQNFNLKEEDFTEITPEEVDKTIFDGIDDSVQLYLKTIGRIDLLTAEEELTLAKAVACGTEEESSKACNKLVRSNLRLVVSIAKRYNSFNAPLLDLIQEGNTGLMKAAEKFNYELGYRFSTYASWWIKQSIVRSLNEKEKAIRIPSHALDQINKLKKAVKQLTEEYGRTPSQEEISEKLDFNTEDVTLWKELGQDALSLEAPASKDSEGSLSEVLSNEDAKTPEDELMHQALKNDMLKVLDTLHGEEKVVLQLRYGFNKIEKFHSYEEVSQIMGISKDKLRKIEFKALRKLKNMVADQIKDYLHLNL